MPSRLCLGCGRLTSGRSYCRACSSAGEREKQRRAPWIRLYKTPEWQAAKWAVHKRDGFRCTFADARGRCTSTSARTNLEAHHLRKVSQLWLDAKKNWKAFLDLATNTDNIVTLCYRHHHVADGKPGSLTPSPASARPIPRKRKRSTTRRRTAR